MWSLKLLQYISSPTRRLQKHVWGHEWSKWWVNKPTNNLGRTHSVLADDALCVQTSNWPSSSPGDVAAPGVSCTCFLLCVLFCWCFFFFFGWWWGVSHPSLSLFLLFFPLLYFIFAGWTVYHQTSERVTYKSSSKPRTRFLSGPVSLSICLYLFFSISPRSFPPSLYLTCLSLSLSSTNHSKQTQIKEMYL